MKIILWRGKLHYAGVTLHTAASGAINALDTLWLQLDDAIGEVRLNISYRCCRMSPARCHSGAAAMMRKAY